MSYNVLQIPRERKAEASELFLLLTLQPMFGLKQTRHWSDPSTQKFTFLALISPVPPSTAPFSAQHRFME